ncbi:uncharacterized protein LOC119557523 [Drosophila subpulchrella]|uniref:uncharacterized protein LOC119557523 n=1 Tax=Drosophila subpulchrella TaxID=1486046 RepID=UPI0018A17A52|nr:uncharacterized protein LOC119557523 [Drosophila subpulchrella]
MKFSSSMLICLYGLVICDWILAAPQPKCKLNKTINPSDYEPIDLNEDPIISAEVKAMEDQIEFVNSIVLWPFKFLGNQIREELERLRDNMAVLSELERRNLKILKEKQEDDEGQLNTYEDEEPKSYRRLKNNANTTPFEPWLSLQSPAENLMPLQEHHITVIEIHHFRLRNQTLIASY